MRTRLAVFAVTLAGLAAFTVPIPAFAQQGQPTAQQERMKACNTDAGTKGLKGDARKSFMSECLKAKPVTALTPQQMKMRTCNTQAASQKLSGDARKQFMSSCLKGQ